MNRPTHLEVMYKIARAKSERSTCLRLSVGAVAYNIYGHILATGYNGAPHGLPHCIDVGCLLEDGHCVRIIHAEDNVILQAARRGVALDGCSLLSTHRPCIRCTQRLIQVGVVRIYYCGPYSNDEFHRVQEISRIAKIELISTTFAIP